MKARLFRSIWLRCIGAMGGLVGLALFGGCARQPPSSNFLSGVRLHVIMHFAQPVKPYYYYFFLINNSKDNNAPGPIPIIGPPPINGLPSNGFATGSQTNSSGTTSGANTGGFTDFVLYNGSGQSGFPGTPSNGFAVYHVGRDGNANNRDNFQYAGNPISSVQTSDNPADPNYAKLEFEIDLSQILRDSAGQPIADAMDANSLARSIHFIQVNLIAINAVPIAQQVQPYRFFDSMGDTINAPNNFLNITLTNGPDSAVLQQATYASTSSNGIPEEPNDIYAYPAGTTVDPAVDLISWSIQVRDANQ